MTQRKPRSLGEDCGFRSLARDDWPEPPGQEGGPPWAPLTESPFVGQAEATGRRAGEGPHRFRERPLPRRQPSPAAAGAAAFRRVEKEIVWEGKGVDEVGRE